MVEVAYFVSLNFIYKAEEGRENDPDFIKELAEEVKKNVSKDKLEEIGEALEIWDIQDVD